MLVLGAIEWQKKENQRVAAVFRCAIQLVCRSLSHDDLKRLAFAKRF